MALSLMVFSGNNLVREAAKNGYKVVATLPDNATAEQQRKFLEEYGDKAFYNRMALKRVEYTT
jgi:cysteine synthase